jgi:beta-glucosidase
MTKRSLFVLLLATVLIACNEKKDPTEAKIDELISQMTLQEKIGQMNQLTGSGLSDDMKTQVKNGVVGSILNETDPEIVNELQRIAVEETRLGIPLIFARDVIHGFKTIFPIPLDKRPVGIPKLQKKAHVFRPLKLLQVVFAGHLLR